MRKTNQLPWEALYLLYIYMCLCRRSTLAILRRRTGVSLLESVGESTGLVKTTFACHFAHGARAILKQQTGGKVHLDGCDEHLGLLSRLADKAAAESLLAERQARRDLSHTMPAGRHRGNNQAYHIVHKLIVGWTTWKMRMGFMGKPLVADVVVFFLHWTDILLQFLAAKV